MPPRQVGRVYAHELGHVIDQIVGHIRTDDLLDELRPLYHELNTGRIAGRRAGGKSASEQLLGPADQGYEPDEVPRELIVEAIRAYIEDPNALKTIAPRTAARIRGAVNEHPELQKIIQFNVGGPGPLALAVGPVQTPPPTIAAAATAKDESRLTPAEVAIGLRPPEDLGWEEMRAEQGAIEAVIGSDVDRYRRERMDLRYQALLDEQARRVNEYRAGATR